MKLKDFLRLISDDDARIELQLDLDDEDEYLYSHFWLSDYLLNSLMLEDMKIGLYKVLVLNLLLKKKQLY